MSSVRDARSDLELTDAATDAAFRSTGLRQSLLTVEISPFHSLTLLLTSAANPSFVGLLNDLNIRETGISEQILMLANGQ